MYRNKGFKPGDLIKSKRDPLSPIRFVIASHDIEVPSKMPPRYEKRIFVMFSGEGRLKFESLKEIDALIDFQVIQPINLSND